MFSLGMKQTSRNRYIKPHQEKTIDNYKILECFDLKFVPICQQPKLLIDLSFRVLNCRNALEEMTYLKTDEAINYKYVGKMVITMYNQMTYRFKGISKHYPDFVFEYQSKPTTVAQYLKEKHNVVVKNMKQRLL